MNDRMKHYDVTGEDRKRMVQLISKTTGWKSRYMMMPSCTYQIGGIRVEKDGTMSIK